MYKSKTTDKKKIILSFENVSKGFRENSAVTGFYIFDLKLETWFPAQAKIEKDKILVWNDNVTSPLHVRFGFGNTIIGNVFSKEGLPLCPFRTDNFDVDQSPVK